MPVTGYDRHCRNISREEAEARIAAGEKAVIRFKVPETGVTEFDDMIRGHISYQNELLDDLVLIKRDGYPRRSTNSCTRPLAGSRLFGATCR